VHMVHVDSGSALSVSGGPQSGGPLVAAHRHPFNCEPPPEVLMERSAALGGYTPTNLHYVRNHGPAPRLDWGGHSVTVAGRVDRPHTFTMDEIVALPSVTLPVTLVSAAFSSSLPPLPRS